MKENNATKTTPLLQYPYVHEFGTGCNAVVKRNDLYVKCDKQCDGDEKYCEICSHNLYLLDISDRIVGGFKETLPNGYTKMFCYKKIMKKMGENITSLKKKARQQGLTLNMEYVEEMCKKKTIRKKKKKKEEPKDVSIVSDSDEEQEPRVCRGRGRPKNINTKDNSDLFNDLVQGAYNNEEEQNDGDYNSDDEAETVEGVPFTYTGKNEEYKNLLLFISDDNVVYTNSGYMLGNYYPNCNEIMDPF